MDKDTVRRGVFDGLEKFVYASRLLLVPLYLGLIVCLVAYLYAMGKEIAALVVYLFSKPDEAKILETLLIKILSMVDITMVGNLVAMIVIGSYSIFVRKVGEGHVRKPQWLEHISSGNLKVKITQSIVSVALIHLLRLFIEAPDVWVKLAIFGAFIVGMVTITWSNKVSDHPAVPAAPADTKREVVHE